MSVDPNLRVPSKKAESEGANHVDQDEEHSPPPFSLESRGGPEAGWGRGCRRPEAGKEMSLSSCTFQAQGKLH